MAGSQWLTVARALRDAWAALPGYRLPGTRTSGVTVHLLTTVTSDGDPVDGDHVVVGWAPAGQPAGRYDQRTGPLAAARPRDEVGTIRVRSCAQLGDLDPEQALEQAETYLGDLEQILRGTPGPDLGVVPGTLSRLLVQYTGPADITPVQNERGTYAAVTSAVAYSARI